VQRDRVRFIDYEGKKVFVTDLSGLVETGILPTLAEAARVIRSQPIGSLLTLTDISGTQLTLRTEQGEYDRVGAEGIRSSVAGNGPYVKASAIVAGDDEGKRVIMQFLNRLADRRFEVFRTREEALAWLVRQ
jgi:hypothetical protein